MVSKNNKLIRLRRISPACCRQGFPPLKPAGGYPTEGFYEILTEAHRTRYQSQRIVSVTLEPGLQFNEEVAEIGDPLSRNG